MVVRTPTALLLCVVCASCAPIEPVRRTPVPREPAPRAPAPRDPAPRDPTPDRPAPRPREKPPADSGPDRPRAPDPRPRVELGGPVVLNLSVTTRKNQPMFGRYETGPWVSGDFLWLRESNLGSGRHRAGKTSPYDWANADPDWIADMRAAITRGVHERGVSPDYDGYLQIDFERWMPAAAFRGPMHFKETNPIRGRENEFDRGGRIAFETMYAAVKDACPNALVGFYQFPYSRAHAVKDGHSILSWVYELQDFSTLNVYTGQIWPSAKEERFRERMVERIQRMLDAAPQDKPAVVQQWFEGVADAKNQLLPLQNIRAMLDAVHQIDDPRIVMVTVSGGEGLYDRHSEEDIRRQVEEVLVPAATTSQLRSRSPD